MLLVATLCAVLVHAERDEGEYDASNVHEGVRKYQHRWVSALRLKPREARQAPRGRVVNADEEEDDDQEYVPSSRVRGRGRGRGAEAYADNDYQEEDGDADEANLETAARSRQKVGFWRRRRRWWRAPPPPPPCDRNCRHVNAWNPTLCKTGCGHYITTPWYKDCVNRGGRWYRNRHSNSYYSGGHWKQEHPAPHPSNPTIHKIAGAWVAKPSTWQIRQFVHRAGKYWLNNNSNQYYSRGKWITYPAKPNGGSPWLEYIAGEWRTKPKNTENAQWVQRHGRWYKRDHGKDRHTWWNNGKWYVEPTSVHRNDPRYADVRGTFVLRAVTPDIKQYHKRILRWYKNENSPVYYYDEKWWYDSKHHRDPRWRAKSITPCMGNSYCQSKKWYKLSKTKWSPNWILEKDEFGYPRMWQDTAKREYWWYGSWVSRPLTEFEKAEEKKKKKLARLNHEGPGLDLHGVVKRSMKGEVGTFLKWFVKDYLRGKSSNPFFDKEVPERGLTKWKNEVGGRFNPEPQEYPNDANKGTAVDKITLADLSGGMSDLVDADAHHFDNRKRLLKDLGKKKL